MYHLSVIQQKIYKMQAFLKGWVTTNEKNLKDYF